MFAEKPIALALTVSSYTLLLAMILVPMLWFCGGFKGTQSPAGPSISFSVIAPQGQL